MPTFRIVDLRQDDPKSEILVDARIPEHAAERALGMKLGRSGRPQNLVCRVYWADDKDTNMVRLYQKVSDRTPARKASAAKSPHESCVGH